MTGPSRPARDPFARGDQPEHLGRGALGIGFIAAALWVAGIGG